MLYFHRRHFPSAMQHEESRRERKLSALSAHYFARQIPRCWWSRASNYPSASRPASPLHGSGGTVAVECHETPRTESNEYFHLNRKPLYARSTLMTIHGLSPRPSNFPSRTFKPKNEGGHQPRQHQRKGAANYTKFEHLDETKDLAPNLRPLGDQIPLSGAAAKGVLARHCKVCCHPGLKGGVFLRGSRG